MCVCVCVGVGVCVHHAADKQLQTEDADRPTDFGTFFTVAPSLKCVDVVVHMRSLWRSTMLTKWSSGKVESKRESVCRMRVRWGAWSVKSSTRKFFRACDECDVGCECVGGHV